MHIADLGIADLETDGSYIADIQLVFRRQGMALAVGTAVDTAVDMAVYTAGDGTAAAAAGDTVPVDPATAYDSAAVSADHMV